MHLQAKYLGSQLLFLIEMRAVKIFQFELGPTHENTNMLHRLVGGDTNELPQVY